MGFQADFPTDPAEIGKAAKWFFSDGKSRNCQKELVPVAETLRNLGGASAEGTSLLGGSGGMLPRKIFKNWIPEMAFAAF